MADGVRLRSGGAMAEVRVGIDVTLCPGSQRGRRPLAIVSQTHATLGCASALTAYQEGFGGHWRLEVPH